MPRTISRRLSSSLADLRSDFRGFTDSFTSLSVRRTHFAPVFLSTFKRWQKETARSFVAFVRELDPDMPVSRTEYPNHRSYQAALYLRRVAEGRETTMGGRSSVTPYKLLAAVLKGYLPLVHPREKEAWKAIEARSGWRDRDLRKLHATVNRVAPVHVPHAPRLVHHKAAAQDGHRATA